MILNPFTMIRNATKAAMQAGVQDFLEEIAPADAPQSVSLAELSQRFAPPAALEDAAEPAQRKKK